MTDAEMLTKVKTGLSVNVSHNDPNLSLKTLAVKNYMSNLGITTEQIESDLGIAALTVGVMDLWNLSSGEVKFSAAFIMIIEQLMAVSIDVET